MERRAEGRAAAAMISGLMALSVPATAAAGQPGVGQAQAAASGTQAGVEQAKHQVSTSSGGMETVSQPGVNLSQELLIIASSNDEAADYSLFGLQAGVSASQAVAAGNREDEESVESEDQAAGEAHDEEGPAVDSEAPAVPQQSAPSSGAQGSSGAPRPAPRQSAPAHGSEGSSAPPPAPQSPAPAPAPASPPGPAITIEQAPVAPQPPIEPQRMRIG